MGRRKDVCGAGPAEEKVMFSLPHMYILHWRREGREASRVSMGQKARHILPEGGWERRENGGKAQQLERSRMRRCIPSNSARQGILQNHALCTCLQPTSGPA